MFLLAGEIPAETAAPQLFSASIKKLGLITTHILERKDMSN
jgi:hypothetical protein